MKFKKIIAGILASAMAVSAMAISAFADDTSIDLKMVVHHNGQNHISEKVTVSKDGDYTFKLDNVELDPAEVYAIYIKDAYAVDNDGNQDALKDYKSSVPSDFTINLALKINGKDIPINEDMATTMEDKTVVDFCVYNKWAGESAMFVTLPEETITSVEMVATIKVGEGSVSNNNGNTNNNGGDKNQPNTGVEGVAVVAGLAVLATGAIVIAKKRK